MRYGVLRMVIKTFRTLEKMQRKQNKKQGGKKRYKNKLMFMQQHQKMQQEVDVHAATSKDVARS